MDSSDIPVPGLTTGYRPDEVIVYGIEIGKRRVAAVSVAAGGVEYDKGATVRFSTGSAKASIVFADNGGIKSIVIDEGGEYAAGVVPDITFENAGRGTGAKAYAVMNSTAVLNLDRGRWDIVVQALLDETRMRRRELPDSFIMVAAYGYAYEGHCYRFDKPRLLGFECPPGDEVRAPVGCGFDPPLLQEKHPSPEPWYRAWRLRANSRLMELSASTGDVNELILDANKPGQRPPNTYSSHMRLAHRGGRLVE